MAEITANRPYVHQDFPLRVYHKTKDSKEVHNDAEHAAALKAGFGPASKFVVDPESDSDVAPPDPAPKK